MVTPYMSTDPAFPHLEDFDSLPDPFEGVDWSTIPALRSPSPSNIPTEDSEEEYFLDDLHTEDLDGIPELGPPNCE